MRLAMLLICSITLAGCARGLLPDAPPDPAVTANIQASVDQARTEAVACIHKNVPRFASGPDAAPDIASAVYAVCQGPHDVWRAALRSKCMNENPGIHSKVECRRAVEDLEPRIRENVANAVVSYRAAAR